MSGSKREGWRPLAAYLRVIQEARRAGLPTDYAAEEAWPHFQEAVAAALREGRALRGTTHARQGGGMSFEHLAGVGSAESESRL